MPCYEQSASAFEEALNAKPDRDWTIEQRQTRGSLRRLIQDAREQLQQLLPYLRIIFAVMGHATYLDFTVMHSSSWTYRWTDISYEGYDVKKDSIIDYGSKEYSAVFIFYGCMTMK